MVLFQKVLISHAAVSRVLSSHSCMFPGSYVAKSLCAKGLIFPAACLSRVLRSTDHIFQGSCVQILCSLGSTLRWNYRILCKVNVMCHIKLENMGHRKHRTWLQCSLRENIIHVLCTKLSLICHFLPLDISEKFHLTLWTFCTKKSQVFQ